MAGILVPPGDARSVSLIGLGVVFKIMSGILQARPPDVTKIAALGDRFGVTAVGMEWVPELIAKFGLRNFQ